MSKPKKVSETNLPCNFPYTEDVCNASIRASEAIAGALRQWTPNSLSKEKLEEIASSLDGLVAAQKQALSNIKPKKIAVPKKTFFTLFITLLLLAITIAVTILLVNQSSDPSVEVSVTYDIAELIAAILGGGGIAAAGIGYGIKSMQGTALNSDTESKE